MSHTQIPIEKTADIRPWFREPWVWFIIALPTSAVIGCAITIWLAITRPDYLVVDDNEYQHIKAELHATPDQQDIVPDLTDGDG